MRPRTLLSLMLLCGCSSTPSSEAQKAEPVASGPAAEARQSAQPTTKPTEPAVLVAAPKRSAEEPKGAEDGLPRIAALGPHTWIWKKPSRDGLAIGRMRNGTSLLLRSKDPVDGPGCKGKWYAVEPRGYVCDDNTATLDLNDPYYKALAFAAPEPGEWPYRYAHSNGSPMYSRVPTPEQWAESEKGFGPVNSWKPLGEWAKGHEENIVDDPIKATDEVPYFLRGGQRTAPGGNYDTRALIWKRMPPGSMLAYSRSFEMYGRVWLLTPETMVVPADRFSDMKRSTFQGIRLADSALSLPLLWNKAKAPLALLERKDDGSFAETSRTIPAKSPIEISGQEVKTDKMVYYQLRHEPGLYVGKTVEPSKLLDANVSIVKAAEQLPNGVNENEKWLEAKIIPGTLTAYEGKKPVMTTLFSPGKGGPPLKTFKFPDDHSKYATTATGLFPMEWKERVHTMSNEKGEPKVLWFSDVPHQQYLKAPLAMHVAFWHEDFGKRKSAECLNVSPLDGLWLFGWTLPQLPEGWNGVGAGQGNGKSTPVSVTVN